MMLVRRAYGFDPGLRHGVLVRATFHVTEEQTKLAQYHVVAMWKKRRKGKGGVEGVDWLSEDSTFPQIYNFSNWLIEAMCQFPDYANDPVGIDYTPHSVFWNSRRLQAVTQAFFMGYFARGAQTLGHPVIFMPPSSIRSKAKLSQSAEKSTVWEELINTPNGFTLPNSVKMPEDSDTKDALVLAYFVAIANLKRGLTT
jgi:hypothetical protein